MENTTTGQLHNWHKWVLSIGVAFLGGVITAASDHGAGVGDYIRHGLIGAGPAVAALNMTLQRDGKNGATVEEE